MTNYKKIFVVMCVVIGAATYFVLKPTYVEFQPVVFAHDRFENVDVDTAFFRCLGYLLSHDHVPYKIDKNGKVLVKPSLVTDQKLSWNYTARAMELLKHGIILD